MLWDLIYVHDRIWCVLRFDVAFFSFIFDTTKLKTTRELKKKEEKKVIVVYAPRQRIKKHE